MSAPSDRKEGQGTFLMPEMRVQVAGRESLGTVTGIGPGAPGSRAVKVTFDGGGESVDVAERAVVASWIPEVGDDHAVTVAIDRLQLDCMSAEILENPRAVPYLVTVMPATPHRGFESREQLLSWMAERGLSVEGEIPERGVAGHFEIQGQYRRAVLTNTHAFDKIAGLRTREADAGCWTAATITQDEAGVRTISLVGAGCTARQQFDGHVWPANDEHLYVYVPGGMTAFDHARDMRDGTFVGVISGQTLEELRESNPGAQVMASSEVEDQMRVAARTAPVEIDEAEFDSALGAMPPIHHRKTGELHSFQFAERYTADVTWTFAQVGERYFKFRDQVGLPTDAILARIEAAGFSFEPEEALGATP